MQSIIWSLNFIYGTLSNIHCNIKVKDKFLNILILKEVPSFPRNFFVHNELFFKKWHRYRRSQWKDFGGQVPHWFKTVTKLWPKFVRKMEKSAKISKSLEISTAWFSTVYWGNLLFSLLFLPFVLLTHGRSHRFESCIAHHFTFNQFHDFASWQNYICVQKCAHFRLSLKWENSPSN